jgi:ubiquinone/menaquinone biosynthesis C-methylase UbiE
LGASPEIVPDDAETILHRPWEWSDSATVPVVGERRRGEIGKSASREYFDRHAASYETHRRWHNVREPQAVALELLERGADDRLLDVGCGTGAAVREAAPVVARAVGLDLAPGMVEQARTLAADFPDSELVVGDSEALPFADGEFTAVLCSTSIHHYPHPDKAVAEMARVLAPGGRVAIGDANRDRFLIKVLDRISRRLQRSHVRILSSAELSDYLAEAGLRRTGAHSLWHGGYMILLAQK